MFKIEPEKIIEEPIINGRLADSMEEYYVSLALDSLGLRYAYQVPLFGGNTRRGGTILDFLVDTPTPTVIRVMGEYWHKGERKIEDELLERRIVKYFGGKVNILNIPASKLETEEEAYVTIRREMKI